MTPFYLKYIDSYKYSQTCLKGPSFKPETKELNMYCECLLVHTKVSEEGYVALIIIDWYSRQDFLVKKLIRKT